MYDAAATVRHDLEVDRLSAELAGRFTQLAPKAIEDGVHAEFDRRSASPVQDFVPIFVARRAAGRTAPRSPTKLQESRSAARMMTH